MSATIKAAPRAPHAFHNSKADCQWLRETALKADNIPDGYTLPDFRSFVLVGNEDCPTKLHLYSKRSPLVTDSEVATLTYLDGVYYP